MEGQVGKGFPWQMMVFGVLCLVPFVVRCGCLNVVKVLGVWVLREGSGMGVFEKGKRGRLTEKIGRKKRKRISAPA